MNWTGMLVVLAICAGYAVWLTLLLRHRLDAQPRSRSVAERLRGLGLGVLLLPAVQLLAYWPARYLPALVLVTSAVALGLWTFETARLTTKVVPLTILGVGLQGFVLVRSTLRGGNLPGHYGLAAGSFVSTEIVLAQAVALTAAGLWLTARSLRAESGLASLVLRERSGRPRWGLLLFAVVALLVELLGFRFWLVTASGGLAQTAAVVIAALYLIIRRPGLAGNLGLAGLVLFGLYGVALGLLWPAHVPLPSPYNFVVRYGAVLVSSRAWAALAGLQGAALVGLGLWLAPKALDDRVKLLFRSAADAELAVRVVRLTSTRADAVDSATAELRRLERDLHDGAQARLVALGMSLAAAERLIPADPVAASALVAEARESSARALEELRGLVRGICPPVLADRGLGDAVQALALDTPLRTEVTVDLRGRPPLPVETACYFAIAEVLANAVKHAGARQAQVRVWHEGSALKITVFDDGSGGADPQRGSGLLGLKRRLSMFDGVLAVSSPAGGPTIIAIEVPCSVREDPHGNVRARSVAHHGC